MATTKLAEPTPHRLHGAAVIIIVAVITAAAGAAGLIVGAVTNRGVAAAPSGYGVVGSKSPAPAASGSVDTAFATIPVPAGFDLGPESSNSVELVAHDGSGRIFITIADEPANVTDDAVVQQLIDHERATVDPDSGTCRDEAQDALSLTGSGNSAIPGVFVPLCATVTTPNIAAFAARDYYYAAVGKQGDQWKALVINVFGPEDRFSHLTEQLQDWAPEVAWKASAP